MKRRKVVTADLKMQPKRTRRVSLEAIWKDKGFEKLKDLESEIRQIRTEIGSSILSREF